MQNSPFCNKMTTYFRCPPSHPQKPTTTTEQFRLLNPDSTLPFSPLAILTTPRALVIAYRLLRRQSEPINSPRGQPAGSCVDSDAAGTSSKAADTGTPKQVGPSLMVVVPGLFQTLDTIERAVFPLLEAHPKLTVLLVAPPGMPNTHWPVTVSLNGEVRCSCGCFVFIRASMRCGGALRARFCQREVIVYHSQRYPIGSSDYNISCL